MDNNILSGGFRDDCNTRLLLLILLVSVLLSCSDVFDCKNIWLLLVFILALAEIVL